MTDMFHAMFVLIGACFAACTIGASFIFGVATVCRWMSWAPINTTININNYDATKMLVEQLEAAE
jgi:hypothetical protein